VVAFQGKQVLAIAGHEVVGLARLCVARTKLSPGSADRSAVGRRRSTIAIAAIVFNIVPAAAGSIIGRERG